MHSMETVYCWNLLHSHQRWHEVSRASNYTDQPGGFKEYFWGAAAPYTPEGMLSFGTNQLSLLFFEDTSA